MVEDVILLSAGHPIHLVTPMLNQGTSIIESPGFSLSKLITRLTQDFSAISKDKISTLDHQFDLLLYLAHRGTQIERSEMSKMCLSLRAHSAQNLQRRKKSRKHEVIVKDYLTNKGAINMTL